MARTEIGRVRQIAAGAAILLGIGLVVCGVLLGWGYLPGLLGEWIGTMVGVVTTPFFMEGFFVVLGLTVVVAINHWRHKRDGDELVYLEQVDGVDLPADLPEHAKWAVYTSAPLKGEEPSLFEQAEGALAIGDCDAAAAAIAELPEEALSSREVLELRLQLARATGKSSLEREIAEELRHMGGKGS